MSDILDVIRSSQWLSPDAGPNTVKPWGSSTTTVFSEKVRSVTEKILQNNADSFAVLKGLHDWEIMTIPPAARDEKPAKVGRQPGAPSRQPVKVRGHSSTEDHGSGVG